MKHLVVGAFEYLHICTFGNYVIILFEYSVTLSQNPRFSDPTSLCCSVYPTDKPKYLGCHIPSIKVCEFRAELTLTYGEADLPLCIQSAYLRGAQSKVDLHFIASATSNFLRP